MTRHSTTQGTIQDTEAHTHWTGHHDKTWCSIHLQDSKTLPQDTQCSMPKHHPKAHGAACTYTMQYAFATEWDCIIYTYKTASQDTRCSMNLHTGQWDIITRHIAQHDFTGKWCIIRHCMDTQNWMHWTVIHHHKAHTDTDTQSKDTHKTACHHYKIHKKHTQ